jgi:hypothetical protein
MAHQVIRLDFEKVQGLVVTEVLGTAPLKLDDGDIAYDAVTLVFEEGHGIRISPTEDTDELVVEQLSSEGIDRSKVVRMGEFTGSYIGWCWVGQNSQGYQDMFILGLDGIEPTIAFTGMASKVHCYSLTELRR